MRWDYENVTLRSMFTMHVGLLSILALYGALFPITLYIVELCAAAAPPPPTTCRRRAGAVFVAC